jgi:DNA polymerase I-like protein with 3'-5' exonuclease and polymerase domains
MSKIIYFSTENYSKFKLEAEHLEILGDDTIIKKGTKEDILTLSAAEDLQLDVESTMTNFITDKKITVVQLGDYTGDVQYIFDIPRLTEKELIGLKYILSSDIKFYIHHAMFEYTIIKQMWGIDIKNIRDTFILSKLLTNGLTLRKGYNSLAGIVYREFGISLDKGAQTTFDGTILTYEQLIYAALDVVFISAIHDIYYKDIEYWKMKKLYNLECNVVRAVGDMHVNGILFDMEYHKAHTITEFTTKYNSAKQAMINYIRKDDTLMQFMYKNEFIQQYDKYLFKWSSPKVKKAVLNLVVPSLQTSNKTVIKKMLAKEKFSIKQVTFLHKFLDGNYEELETQLINEYHTELVDLNLFIPKGTFLLNFDSPLQRLELFRYWYPNLKDTNAKTLVRLTKGILPEYKKYIKAAKMLSSFGEKMAEYIESDKRIHPSFTQLVSTGRMSSSKPNGQNQPSTSEYRNAYYAREGWSFVGADYSSQEILVAAQASGDKGFWHAIKNGYDLHSYSAYQIYGQKWLDAGGETKPIGKPKTKEANKMRKASKSLSFSLFYGSSALSLAENLNISHKEAQSLMNKYYETFPELAIYFQKQNEFGKKYKFSRGLAPFNRVRFYNSPTNAGEVNSIGRKSQNAGIQGTSADITKLAMIYIKQYIEKQNLGDKVKIILQVHDEIICEVHDSIVKKWAIMQSKLMEKAANVIIPGNWLKAEAEIMKRWNK